MAHCSVLLLYRHLEGILDEGRVHDPRIHDDELLEQMNVADESRSR
jgi:hypothetical protein